MQTVARNTTSELACSENVAYDNVGNIVRMPKEPNVSCSDNRAYYSVKSQGRNIANTSSGHTASYEEVELKE